MTRYDWEEMEHIPRDDDFFIPKPPQPSTRDGLLMDRLGIMAAICECIIWISNQQKNKPKQNKEYI